MTIHESRELVYSPQSSKHTSVDKAYNRHSSRLTESERELIASWNATWHPYPQDLCIPQMVARQALATPGALAIAAGTQSVQYSELNQRANRLAHYLISQGVGPGMLVGLCLERSPEMVIGLLAILKAGGAYVPVDPGYPADRQFYMLEDAHIGILLTQLKYAAQFKQQEDLQMICLDSAAELFARYSTDDPPVRNTVTDPVYVIYTSGSTGRPKGVQITHNSLLNLIYWHQRTFNLSASDRATQLTSPGFDATGWEIWPYLTIGASIHLVDEHIRVEPLALRDYLVEHGITLSFLPTALAERVMGLAWPASCQLRYLLTGADKLHLYPPTTLPFKLINNYGPTEATVLVTSGEVPAQGHSDRAPGIGRPIDNTQIYLLDEQLQQVPIGEVGELYIGGPGLATGYLHQPAYTAEKFIDNPFSQEPGTRLYRTGDLAYYLPDGQIAFVGRVDHQLKIRGYRIEASEIIARLNAYPAIETSYVIAREDEAGDKYLVAYIVPLDNAPIIVSELQTFLGQSLPGYMIPTTFVALEALPLTANGKVNREALPVPDNENILRDEINAQAATPIEEEIAKIVCTLLGIEQVGVDENFFMLGGHSLLGTQIITHISETFGISLPLRTLFEAPTVQLLALEVEERLFETVEE